MQNSSSMAKKNNSLTAIGILLLIGLLGLNVYQWFVNNNLTKELNQQKSELYELEKVQTELDQDYQAALENLEELRGDNESANKLIEEQKIELKNQKSKISSLIWTKGELSKAKEEIALMNSQVSSYINEINILKSTNSKLSSANALLTSEKGALETQLVSTKSTVEELGKERMELMSVKEKLSASNTELSSKVNMAEAIKINYISVEGFQVSSDGKLKSKSRAKKVDLLKTCMKTETNLVTTSGQKEFQIRFIDPTGSTVASAGSGVITEALSGKDYKYSFSGKLDYQNKDTDVCLDWNPGIDFVKGNYQVQVFNNDFLVGKGEFRLK